MSSQWRQRARPWRVLTKLPSLSNFHASWYIPGLDQNKDRENQEYLSRQLFLPCHLLPRPPPWVISVLPQSSPIHVANTEQVRARCGHLLMLRILDWTDELIATSAMLSKFLLNPSWAFVLKFIWPSTWDMYDDYDRHHQGHRVIVIVIMKTIRMIWWGCSQVPCTVIIRCPGHWHQAGRTRSTWSPPCTSTTLLSPCATSSQQVIE